MSDALNPTSAEIRAMAQSAVDWLIAYYDSLRDRPVLGTTSSAVLRERLTEPLPQSGAAFPELLAAFDSIVTANSRHNGHPRFFGYVASPGAPVATIGAALAATLNINVTSWRSAPAGTEMERVTMGWLKEMLGYPASSLGVYTSGGSMANFAGLAAARSAKAPVNIARDGLSGCPPMRLYVSEEGHFSLHKAAAMLGLGDANVRRVPTDSGLRIDLYHLRRMVAEDRAAGFLPFAVVANAGTTATGAFDPLRDLAAFARSENLWLHVDAAYGGFAALAPSLHPLFDGIAEADSVALDPHKWLYLPVGCGSVLYRDPATARAAFSHSADYIRTIGLEHDEAFVFWDYSPELSRPFRALDVWLMMKSAGALRLAEAIETNVACAQHFGRLVAASEEFEMLAPVGLSVFCFRYAPRGYSGDLDALNERVLVELQQAGGTYLSNARIRGNFALRGCVLNYRTTLADMDRAFEDVRAAARQVAR
jgi:aromatic-L-amino-acid/L-tryptophan decarboxylase